MPNSDSAKMFQTALLIGAGTALVISLYGLLYVYPAWQTLKSVKRSIASEKADMECRKTLFPVQAKVKILEGIRFKGRLPFPERVAMPKGNLTSLPREFNVLALRHGLSMTGSSFHIGNMDDGSQLLPITLTLEGKLRQFRDFLIGIMANKAFKSISALDIRSGRGELKIISLTLNIRIKKAGP